jgi:ribosomal protein L11 methyltransferase
MTHSDWMALAALVPAAAADGVANFLLEQGAPGVVTADRDLDGPAPDDPRVRIEAHFPADAAAAVEAALRRYLTSLAELGSAGALDWTIETAPVPPVDWTALARRHHRPRRVGRRFVVAPPWEVPDEPDRIPLVIEPGMAFGTGQHGSTAGALEALEARLEAHPVASALDAGTGSGVLALALARLGVPRVVAFDVDPAVLPIARANLAANGIVGVTLVAGPLAAIHGRYDLVVANILADVLVVEAPALAAAVAPGGALVLAGLLDTQAPGVAAAYPGWRVVDVRRHDEWDTLTLERAP